MGTLTPDERRTPFGILVGITLVLLVFMRAYRLGWQAAAALAITAGLLYHLGGTARRAMRRRA